MNIYDFKEFLNKKFGNKLTIISNVDNFKYRDYLDVYCKTHGEYRIRFDHLKDYGCPKCAKLSTIERNKQSFINQSKVKHKNKYDYSKVDYKTNKELVEIICPKHGSFKQRPDNHIAGAGCTYCNYKVSKDDFIKKANNIHKGLYNYDKSDFIKTRDMITITCPKHGDFTQRSSSHLCGSGCPNCQESKGEKIISDYLSNLKINFKKEKKFLDFSKYIEFDFYLPDYNTCVEYDGIQHFEPVNFFGGEDRLENTKRIDKMKNKYCVDNKINLLRISYKEDIISKLDEFFNLCKPR